MYYWPGPSISSPIPLSVRRNGDVSRGFRDGLFMPFLAFRYNRTTVNEVPLIGFLFCFCVFPFLCSFLFHCLVVSVCFAPSVNACALALFLSFVLHRVCLQSLATVVGLAVARRLKLPFIGAYSTPETPTQAWPYMPHGGAKVCNNHCFVIIAWYDISSRFCV